MRHMAAQVSSDSIKIYMLIISYYVSRLNLL